MPNRSFNAPEYKYGFNGKENDKESDTQDYGMRIYNPALGKFLSVDPIGMKYAWNSTYAFAENDVIRCIDLDGLEKFEIQKLKGGQPVKEQTSQDFDQLSLKLIDPNQTTLQVVDENGVTLQTFKYQDFACQMIGYKMQLGKNRENKMMPTKDLYTPKINGGDKLNDKENFNITTTNFALIQTDPGAKLSATGKEAAESTDWGGSLNKEPVVNNPTYNILKISNGVKGFDTQKIISDLTTAGAINSSTQIEVVENESGKVEVELGNVRCP
jgi:RHS repeat-associated protein